MDIAIQWYLRYYPCHNEFINIEVSARDFICDVCVLKVICPDCFQMFLKWQFIICRKCMSERLRVVARAWIPTRWGRGSSSNTDTPQ